MNMKPNLNIEESYYHSIQRVSNSGLSAFRRSPAHFWQWWKEIETGVTEQETPSQRFGSAVHVAVLEPEKFDALYAIRPDVNGRTKEGKAVLEAFEAKNRGKTIITATEHEAVIQCRDAVRSNPVFRNLVAAEAEMEKEIYWTDSETGLEMKAKLDLVTPEIVIDLKTTTDADPASFPRSASNYGYHRQAALYLEALQLSGVGAEAFFFVCVEKVPPYAVSIFQATTDFLEHGQQENRALLSDLKTCFERNEWPGYEWKSPTGVHPLDLPPWAKTSF